MTAGLRGLLPVLWLGCVKPAPPPVAPVQQPATLVEQARARQVPQLLTARLSLKLRSKPLGLAGSTGGGLVVERPGRGRFQLFGPLGGSLLAVDMDGTALGVFLPADTTYLVAEQADEVVAEVSGGVAGLDDLIAVLVGDLPFDAAEVASVEPMADGSAMAVLMGPDGTTVTASIDALGTPRVLEATDAQGARILSAEYGEFQPAESGALLPTTLHVELPALELSADLKYKSWAEPGTAPLGFVVQAPEGAHTASLEDAVRSAVEQAVAPAP